MPHFFNTAHCATHAHCATCRALEAGRPWRESIARTFSDVGTVDFECPAHLPWGAGPQALRPVETSNTAVIEAIRSAPAKGPWRALKRHLRLLEAQLAGQTSPCSSCAGKGHAKLLRHYTRLQTTGKLDIQPHF